MDEGWGWPGMARKAHYFKAGDTISVCRKWMYSGLRDPDTKTDHADDCKPCQRYVHKHVRGEADG